MFKVISLWLFASLVPAVGQPPGGGIEGVRIGMSHETVDVALNRQDVIKVTDTRDRTQDTWSFTDLGGLNTISFHNGRVVAVDAHVSTYRGDGRDLVKKLYSLLYPVTKATPSDERATAATVVLREYPSVTGDDPIRVVELRSGDQRIDLTVIENDSLTIHEAFVGRGIGDPPRFKK